MAWLWILLGAGTGMSAMDVIGGSSPDHMASMMAPALWTAAYAGIMFTMWWVMMAAMMLPSAAPILLLFARISRKEKSAGRPFIPTGIFAAGYLIAWGAFSAVATGLQWAFEQLGLLSPMMVTTSYSLGGAILLAAGVWELTPIKGICLRHCRSPMGFFMQSWRPGRGGAFRMGLEHGMPGLLPLRGRFRMISWIRSLGPTESARRSHASAQSRQSCGDIFGPHTWQVSRHR
jgi:predicted metal-binding membrane protein